EALSEPPPDPGRAAPEPNRRPGDRSVLLRPPRALYRPRRIRRAIFHLLRGSRLRTARPPGGSFHILPERRRRLPRRQRQHGSGPRPPPVPLIAQQVPLRVRALAASARESPRRTHAHRGAVRPSREGGDAAQRVGAAGD